MFVHFNDIFLPFIFLCSELVLQLLDPPLEMKQFIA
ncbi:hypothetical protein GLYMA_12G191050v4 [Glycine max]|nr:hypothetical protein GLYMA_12G191050v4 [Glycine max]KAH1143926.1 hypothetical protein GYH30_034243 [Glycine max]